MDSAMLANANMQTGVPLQLVLLGATGFVGSAVMRQALAAGMTVHALVHARALPTLDRLISHRGSLQKLPPSLLPGSPHVVMHCANRHVDVGTGFGDNLRGIENLAAAINPHTRAVLYTSSYSVYGDGPHRGVAESAPVAPRSALAKSRAECECKLLELARRKGCRAIILRTRFIVGKGDTHFLPGLARFLSTPLRIGSGQQKFSVIDVDDYARVLLALANDEQRKAAPAEIFNVAYQQPVSLAEIQQVLTEELGIRPRTVKLSLPRWLVRLDALPSPRLQQFAARLRLVGDDQYGTVDRLRSYLAEPILRADPIAVVRRAARHLAIAELS
jgi:nucleoside-diphosphate-sugar epimerase